MGEQKSEHKRNKGDGNSPAKRAKPAAKAKPAPTPAAPKGFSTKVSLVIYDSYKDESPDEFERVMSMINSDEKRYEIMSLDKSITQTGAFICALMYRELPEIVPEEDLEVTINPDEDIADVSDFQ